MKTVLHMICAAALTASLAAPLAAQETPSHYDYETSDTLAEALENFNTYNRKIAEVLERTDLTEEDMEEIHEYTYTIEVALAKINESLAGLPVTLELLHKASESHNAAAVQGVGEVYLENALPLAD